MPQAALEQDELLQKAIAEAYASCPVDDGVVLYTLEFLHPTFDQPARIVRWPITNNEPEKFSLRLENEAPANPGEYVDFIAVPFDMTFPAQEENAPGEIKLSIENVGPVLTKALASAVGQREPVRLIAREYLKSMPDYPQFTHPDYSIAKAKVSNNNVEGTATMLDWLLRLGGDAYTPTDWPGLVRGR